MTTESEDRKSASTKTVLQRTIKIAWRVFGVAVTFMIVWQIAFVRDLSVLTPVEGVAMLLGGIALVTIIATWAIAVVRGHRVSLFGVTRPEDAEQEKPTPPGAAAVTAAGAVTVIAALVALVATWLAAPTVALVALVIGVCAAFAGIWQARRKPDTSKAEDEAGQ